MTQNRLAEQKSPYLLQHADNPVDWYPWGDEAFETARKQDKPVFLSIGYATCHWCHVMAHESFEDTEVAELMNDAFVNIKVDREERPDIDHTYMTVCQMLTGSGGWPLTILMTPEKKPFYAATYIPKRGRHGRVGMLELIPRIQRLWEEQREKIYGSADEIAGAFEKSSRMTPGNPLSEDILHKAYESFRSQYDPENGGFGGAPKFPSPHNLLFLLRYWKRSGEEPALEMATRTLTRMRRGGLYDHIGFGFHRYATDSQWLLPHFEKMLYDQAMLMMAYTEAWQATGEPLFRRTVEEIADYLFREMLDAKGGFYSAEDADSEGEEGKFYVWSIEQVRKLLPQADAELFIEVYNLNEEGNYREEATGHRTGKNIPHLKKSISELAAERSLEPEKLRQTLESIRETLFSARKERVRPLLDDKILTDWNGLAIAALARAGRILDKPGLTDRAGAACHFVLDYLRNEDGSLLHRFRDGEAAIAAHADDYAFMTWGLLELYEATFETRYLQQAGELNVTLIEKFWDEENGGFFFTAEGGEHPLARKKEGYDGALPSGNSAAMMNLLRLGRITADTELEEHADRIGRLWSEQIRGAPSGFGQMLQAVDFAAGPSYEIVIAGERNEENTQALLRRLNGLYIPKKVTVFSEPEDEVIRKLAPYTAGQTMLDDQATAYVCRNYSCERPVTDPDDLAELLREAN